MSGFTSPNHTQTPNDLFDVHMKDMGECELKVVLCAVRQTLGYHRKSDEISISQFQKMTGLSRQGVVSGIEAAMKRGVLQEVGSGRRGVKRYGLVIIFDQSEIQTSTGQEFRPVNTTTSQKSRHTKESIKETKKEKEIAPAAQVAPRDEKVVTFKPRNHWYDAIFETWGYTGGLNGDLEKMLRGVATKKGYKEYNLEQPLESPTDILEWRDWYLKVKNKGRADTILVSKPVKIQSSFGEWQHQREQGKAKPTALDGLKLIVADESEVA